MTTSDLSGHWHGMFSYPRALEPGHFEASLIDGGGVISGETTETGQVGRAKGRVLHALIDGKHEGATVRFTKVYDDYHQRPIHYLGTANDEGTEIFGRWEIPGAWAGNFIMVRAPRAIEAASIKETVSV